METKGKSAAKKIRLGRKKSKKRALNLACKEPAGKKQKMGAPQLCCGIVGGALLSHNYIRDNCCLSG